MTKNTATTTPAPETTDAPVITMAQQLQSHRANYVKTLGVNNKGSMDNDDQTARQLRAMDPDVVVTLAEVVTGQPTGSLTTAYANLNRGQRRMNAGNRIRNAIKRGDITMADVKAAMK